ncbi:MAG: hypothetical protein M1533_00545 [Candidatus Thermoplasmatota archaeon]|nr:hypothetical protein [Candidatus Thermoplasmatota archaeon]MCL5794263.1 hypothetical protein [Candidatus Thermoplasmatota archaeon]
MRILHFVTFLSNDSDPFYSRELILILLAYGIMPAGLFADTSTYSFSYIISVVGGAFFVTFFIYVIILSANNARMVESGYFTFLLTMPLRKRNFLISRLIFPSIVTGLLFTSVLIPLMIVSAFGFFLTVFLTVCMVSLAMLFMYLSIGYLISFITRNSVLTFISLFLIFAAEYIYAGRIKAENHILSASILGDLVLSSNSIFSTGMFFGTSLAILLGTIALAGQYVVLKRLNLRSGR